MGYWPGVDRWPPPLWVWVTALILTFAVPAIAVVFGAVGIAVVGVFVIVCLVIGANARLKRMGAEEFWESRPKDDL
jgi:hypothetical protein